MKSTGPGSRGLGLAVREAAWEAVERDWTGVLELALVPELSALPSFPDDAVGERTRPAAMHLAQVRVASLTVGEAGEATPPRVPGHGSAAIPVLAGALDALAARTSGCVWRHPFEFGTAPTVEPGRSAAVEFSVWRGYAELWEFVFASRRVVSAWRRHSGYTGQMSRVLWWVPQGHEPTLAEARRRLACLCQDGPSPMSFTLRSPVPPAAASPMA